MLVSFADIGYLAGLVDGEGTISLHFRRGRFDLQFRVVVYSTTEEVIDWLTVKFGGSKYKVGRRKVSHHAQEYQWFVSGEKAFQILLGIEPYLIIKKAKAKVALEAWQNRHITPLSELRRGVPEPVINERAEYVELFRRTN